MSSNQMACYDVLRSRFSIARSDMNRISPTTSSSVSRSTSQALDFHSNHAQYNHAFLYTFPNAKVIAGTPQCSIVLGLKRYESAMTKRNFMMGETESSNLGAWGWALLARCRPTQQMDGEDIAVVREVGKTAIRLIKKIRRESKDIESSSQQSEHEDDMENGTLDLQTDSHDQEQSVIFALDILVTVIGEEFGQRDLLNSRENW